MLKISSGELKNYSASMKKEIEIMKENLQKASNIMSRTSNSYQSSSADAFREKYKNLENKFNDFYEAMSNYAVFLDNTANIYEEKDKTIKNKEEEFLVSDYTS